MGNVACPLFVDFECGRLTCYFLPQNTDPHEKFEIGKWKKCALN